MYRNIHDMCVHLHVHAHAHVHVLADQTHSYLMQNRLIMVYMYTTIAASIATGAIGVTEMRLVTDVMRRHRRR